jgi:hypothetical protein
VIFFIFSQLQLFIFNNENAIMNVSNKRSLYEKNGFTFSSCCFESENG